MSETVSIILPVFNEENVIGRVITSLLEQEIAPYSLEILVIDGNSTDGTASIVKALHQRDARIVYLLNEKRKTPNAFNIGLANASGNYIAILGAHCIYDKNYLRTCLDELHARNATGCSGRTITIPANDSFEAATAAFIMGSSFGVSSNSFRTQPEGFVDSIPYPVYRKTALTSLGGYNEALHRNQDNDMNERLRASGATLYCTYKTTCRYLAKSTIRGILQYARTNGRWNAYSIRVNPKSMSWRHFIPFFFLLYVLSIPVAAMLPMVIPALCGWWMLYLVPAALYIAGAVYASLPFIARFPSRPGAYLMPLYFLLFHLNYGYGTLLGIATGRT